MASYIHREVRKREVREQARRAREEKFEQEVRESCLSQLGSDTHVHPLPGSADISPGHTIENPIIVQDIEDPAEVWKRTRRATLLKARRQWNSGTWGARKALDRYRFFCSNFDKVRFSSSQPLKFGDIPWPIYDKQVLLEGITWTEVEKFFVEMDVFINDDEVYRRLLKESQVR